MLVKYNVVYFLFMLNQKKIFKWVRWHPKGHLVLAGAEDSSMWMWNADKAAYLNVFTGHAASVTCGDFTPDGINFIMRKTLDLLFHYDFIWQFYYRLLLLSVGKTICSGSDDATMRIWNPKTAEIIHVVRGMLFDFHLHDYVVFCCILITMNLELPVCYN